MPFNWIEQCVVILVAIASLYIRVHVGIVIYVVAEQEYLVLRSLVFLLLRPAARPIRNGFSGTNRDQKMAILRSVGRKIC